MSNNITVYHHLGLGDHFICNGIIRTLAEKFDKIYLFCKPHNIITVQQMYSDICVSLIPAKDDAEVLRWASESQVFSIGFSAMNTNENFDQQFYRQVGLDLSERWGKFKCHRNLVNEDKLIECLDLPEKFALIHEDASRGYAIDKSRISLPTVSLRPMEGFSMIDWLGVADRAAEIHGIDSSFVLLVDSVETKADLFIHRYARGDFPPSMKKNWTIYEH